MAALGLRGFERRIERMVEGVFGRVFSSGLRPVELGRKLAREMDSSRSVGVKGREVVPNHFTIELSTEDYESFADVRTSLARELCDAAREHAETEAYHFMGPVEVEFGCREGLRTGSFEIVARLRQAERSTTGALVMADGSHVLLDGDRLLIGRLPDCRVQLSDTNVSRHHAEVRPDGSGHVVTDLGSTNGTRVNGQRVESHALADGDEIMVGGTRLRFEAPA